MTKKREMSNINLAKYEDYRDKCFAILNQLRQSNGTFRAAFGEHYDATWIRDNFWNSQSYLDLYPDKYLETCHTHLDFLKMYENEYGNKLSWLIKDTDVYGDKEHRFLHPKVNYDGTEIEGLKWRFIQQDGFSYYILMMYNGWKKGLEVFRNHEDRYVIQLLVKISEALEIDRKPYAHSWEENVDIFSSNLYLSIKALECAYEMGFDVDRGNLKRVRAKFNQQFPRETASREWDLTLLFICVLDNSLSYIEVEDIVNGVTLNLERQYGVCRYLNDVYRPFAGTHEKSEMQWLMGYGYLGIIHIKQGNIQAGMNYIDKMINSYPDARIPEGVDAMGRPCDNTPLAWSISMCIQAINELIKTVDI